MDRLKFVHGTWGSVDTGEENPRIIDQLENGLRMLNLIKGSNNTYVS